MLAVEIDSPPFHIYVLPCYVIDVIFKTAAKYPHPTVQSGSTRCILIWLGVLLTYLPSCCLPPLFRSGLTMAVTVVNLEKLCGSTVMRP